MYCIINFRCTFPSCFSGLIIHFFLALNNILLVDYATDMSDSDHVNIKGATKLTHYLGEYLMQNYNLTSHAGDNSYDDWNDSYEQFRAEYDGVVLKESEPD